MIDFIYILWYKSKVKVKEESFRGGGPYLVLVIASSNSKIISHNFVEIGRIKQKVEL
jgi:hypothetical protein